MRPFPDQAVSDLARSVFGTVLRPGDSGYEQECASYNILVPVRPALVVGAASVEDVQQAVRFAAHHNAPVAVLGDGHLTTGPLHEAVLITLTRMAGLRIDAPAQVAHVTGSTRWQAVVEKAAESGLAPIDGSSPRVGVIGYLLGGGLSPTLGRTYGYASDHILRMEVVAADGTVCQVGPEENAELFFALRGGKGNFGVVTQVAFRLFPVRTVFGGGLWFSGERMAEVLRRWRDWVVTVPESMTSSVAIQRLPDQPELPAPLRGAFVVHVRIAYLEDARGGEALIAPLRELADPILDTVAEIPYSEAWTIHADPPGPMPYVDLGTGLRELPDEALLVFDRFVGPASDCPLASVEIRALGGALAREPEIPDAVPSRPFAFETFAFGVGAPEAAPGNRAYLRAWHDALGPWREDQAMVNFLSPDEGHTEAEVRRAYGPERYEALARIKAVYDPDNLFRLNHNIRPARLPEVEGS